MPNAPVENTKPLSVIANDNEPVKMDVDPPEPKIILDQEKEVSKKETVAKKHKPQAIDAVYTEYKCDLKLLHFILISADQNC